MPAPNNLREIIYNYPTKSKYGFTKAEIAEVLKKYNIDYKDFSEKLICVTCMMQNNELVFYPHDVYYGIVCCIEKRNPKLYEID